jgi:acetyl esterase/lipase
MTNEMIYPEVGEPLTELLAQLPQGMYGHSDIVERRKFFSDLLQEMEQPANPDVTKDDRRVPGPPGGPDIVVRVYTPVARPAAALPYVYYIHGGGFVLETLEDEDAVAASFCDALQSVVVAVDYRLAPEHPYPAGLDDCVAGYVWLLENADALGVDAARVAVFGASAGGGLALALALRVRDEALPPPAFVMAPYPMIDDTNTTPSSHEVLDVGMWDRQQNVEAWDWYLGGRPADQYAAPARAADLSGLPPTFIDVGTVDVFRDEDIEFAARLLRAGVPVELHVYPGAYHSSEFFAPSAALSQRMSAARLSALKRALAS